MAANFVDRQIFRTFGAKNELDMKKLLPIICGLLLASSLRAEISIEDGAKYYFVCDLWESGNMALGAQHGAAAFIYYNADAAELSADSYWILKTRGKGYTIQNAQSKEYIVYKDERLTNDKGEFTAKGLQLATGVTDNSGVWVFNENPNGSVYITCQAAPNINFNVRTDGSGLVGTYTVSGSSNEFFHIYHENGTCISSNASGNTGGGSGNTGGDSGKSEYGMTADGRYWENTGLAQPFVLTTSTSNPVLYTIENVRSGQFVYANDSYQLFQDKAQATKFYFMQSGGDGIQIFTQDGSYVSTSFWTMDEDTYPLSLNYGRPATGSDIWTVGYYMDYAYPGYTIQKLDKLPSQDASQSAYLYWNDYNKQSYHCVGLYDLDGGGTFIFSSSDSRHRQYLESMGLRFNGSSSSKSELSAYIDSIRIDDKDLVLDSDEGVYYYPLPQGVRGGADYTATMAVRYAKSDATYAVRIDDVTPDAEGLFTLPGVTCSRDYTLTVVKNGTEDVASAPLRFTFLPLVEVNVPSANGSYYTTGSIRVTDPNIAGRDSIFIAAYKYRGATAQNYAKKSYAIKLRDEQGNSVDREFFGLRNDNNWILDAMAIDRACMRNRVATDLWNDFATYPYHRREGWEKKARSGTRGRFVEVFLNGKYHGLYCMTEKMDRKQLKLKKFVPATETSTDTIHGSLYKSSQWSYEVFMGHESGSRYFPKVAPQSYNNNDRRETWADYEVKYPDYEEERIDWGPLWNAINMVATSSDQDFIMKVDKYFDRPVLNDYYLFIELMLATDNHGKNIFFYNYDQLGSKFKERIGVAPWDLDGTWGRRWDGSNDLTYAAQDFTNFLWSWEHGTHTLFHRLAEITSLKWEDALKDRYAEVRPTAFDKDNLKKRFTDYAELFAESHADAREQARWSSLHSDIQKDVEYICDWIDERVDYLDNQYGFDPTTVGLSQVAQDAPYFSAAGGKGCISIHAPEACSLPIYSIGGVLLRTVHTTQSQTIIDGFTPGVYIVGDKKVIVK